MITVPISTAASGDTLLVTGKPGQVIRVLNIVAGAASAVSIKFKSGSTDLTGAIPVVNPLATTWCGYGPGGSIPHFKTALGENLSINLSGAIAVGGWLNYEFATQ